MVEVGVAAMNKVCVCMQGGGLILQIECLLTAPPPRCMPKT